MKNILLFMLFGFVVFVISCKGKAAQPQKTLQIEESKPIDFSETKTLQSSAAYLQMARGYIFDSAKAVVYDDIDFFGHYMEQVDVLFYIDPNKNVRMEYQIPTTFGSISKSYVVDFLVILSGTLSSDDNKVTIGGDDQILRIKSTVYLIFDSRKKAIKAATTLGGWFKQLLKTTPEDIEIKGTNI